MEVTEGGKAENSEVVYELYTKLRYFLQYEEKEGREDKEKSSLVAKHTPAEFF